MSKVSAPARDEGFKIIIIGDSGTGKTCLLRRYVDDNFDLTLERQTIGMDFRTKKIRMGDLSVSLQIWDTAGQDKFNSLTASYFRGVDAVIVVFDTTDMRTLLNVDRWLAEARRHGPQEFLTMLLGNKDDAEAAAELQVEEIKAQAVAEKLGVKYFRVSAKKGYNVDEAFTALVSDLVANRLKQNINTSNGKREISYPRPRRRPEILNAWCFGGDDCTI